MFLDDLLNMILFIFGKNTVVNNLYGMNKFVMNLYGNNFKIAKKVL